MRRKLTIPNMRHIVIAYVYCGGVDIVMKFFSKKFSEIYIKYIDVKENSYVVFKVKKQDKCNE